MSKLRRVLCGWWSGLIGKSFRGFLARKYGAKWSRRLVGVRQQRADLLSQQQGGSGGGSGEKGKEKEKKEHRPSDEDFLHDTNMGRRALHQVFAGEWWDWTKGSSLLFWRWDVETQLVAARDGMQIFDQAPHSCSQTRTWLLGC
jgi:hypothetical protein